MSLLNALADHSVWEEYLLKKREGRHLTKWEDADLAKLIEDREYEPVVRRLLDGGRFSVPEKKQIQKIDSQKKRIVYVFPREENHIQKLLAYLLIRKYDSCFSDNLYSFRVRYGVSRAVQRMLRVPGLQWKYTYKADISNYFNSIDTEKMLGVLAPVLADDPMLYKLFSETLTDRSAFSDGELITEDKGVMAGSPLAVFFANLYLNDLDRSFEDGQVLYARYSDDIIVLADSEEEREQAVDKILKALEDHGLTVNHDKEFRTGPGERWTFLGFSYENGIVDVAPVSAKKLKAKMRRRARAIKRWQIRKNATGLNAATAFIRSMNRKFFDADSSHELTWTRWYFPLITTDRTLEAIDHYMQDWVRYLVSGHHRKGNYRFRYDEMKQYGYESLVHAWYIWRSLAKEKKINTGTQKEETDCERRI